MSDFVQLATSTDRAEHADELAALLVERRLAACAQVVGPIRSHYRWRGEVERAEEWLVLAKTTAAQAGSAQEAIEAAHHYEVPEITITAIDGSDAYLAWVAESAS